LLTSTCNLFHTQRPITDDDKVCPLCKFFSDWCNFLGDWIGPSPFTFGVFEGTISQSQLSHSFTLWFCDPDMWWYAVFGAEEADSQVCLMPYSHLASTLEMPLLLFLVSSSM